MHCKKYTKYKKTCLYELIVWIFFILICHLGIIHKLSRHFYSKESRVLSSLVNTFRKIQIDSSTKQRKQQNEKPYPRLLHCQTLVWGPKKDQNEKQYQALLCHNRMQPLRIKIHISYTTTPTVLLRFTRLTKDIVQQQCAKSSHKYNTRISIKLNTCEKPYFKPKYFPRDTCPSPSTLSYIIKL